MSDIRPHDDIGPFEPRKPGGVVGYIAELQQLDNASSKAGPDTPAVPVGSEHHAVALGTNAPDDAAAAYPAGDDAATYLAGDDAANPPRFPDLTEPPVARQVRGRLVRVAVLSAAVTSALVVAGLGYAALNEPASIPRAQRSAPVDAPTASFTPEPLSKAGATPGVERVRLGVAGADATASPSATKASATSATGDGAGRREQALALGSAGSHPATRPPTKAKPRPAKPATAKPWRPGRPAPKPTSPPASPTPVPTPRLTAEFTYTTDSADSELTGVTGQVHIRNPGTRDVYGWWVSIEVPGDYVVSDGDHFDVVQTGGVVVFTPTDDSATVQAGSSVIINFAVDGVLSDEPSGCVINGYACD